MNWKELLKDKAGLTQSAKFMLTAVGVGAVAFYTLSGAADEQVRQERAIRDLSSMSASSPYAGLRQSTGGLSSINVKDARGQLATAREREAMERNSGANSDFGLSAVESLGSGSVGQAMQFSDSFEGLATGGDKGPENAARFASGADAINMGAYSGHGATGAGASAAAGAGVGENTARASYAGDGGRSGGTGQLGSASMARASGSSSSSSYNPASPSGGSSAGKTRGGESAYQMSGAMPDGSSMLAMSGSHNPKKSGFSSSRDLQAGRTQKNGRGRGELRDIMEKSIAAADNTARSANEGARAFQAGETSSSGLGRDTFGGVSSASSSDFSTSTKSGFKAPKVDVNKNKIDAKTDWIERRDKAIEKLNKTFTTNILIALGLIIGGAALLNWMKGLQYTWPGCLLYWGAAALLLGGVVGLMIPIFKQAGDILKEFANPPEGVTPNNFGIIMKEVLGGAAIGAMAAVAVFPEFAWGKVIKPLAEKVFVQLPGQVFGAVKNLVSSEMNRNYK